MVGERFTHPFEVWKALWPDVYFYDKQRDQIQAFRDAEEVCVVAGNELGKDFVWGFICPSFFMFPWVYFPESKYEVIDRGMRGKPATWESFLAVHTRRMLTTSVKAEHLGVLWGEIGRFIRTAQSVDGQRLIDIVDMTDMELRFACEKADSGTNVVNYLRGQVVNKGNAGEGMAGHHAAYTAGVCDEASAMSNVVDDQWLGWADKRGYFGNAFDTQNVWRKHYEEARYNRESPWELRGEDGKLIRKAIQIKATDSPNVKLGLLQKARGETPTDEVLVPGIITYGQYSSRRNPKVLDRRQQTIKLDAEFYDGAEDKLVPKEWLEAAHEYYERLQRLGSRTSPRYMGVDCGEGGDDSAWCVVDRHGIIATFSKQTPDTNEVVGVTMDMCDRWDVPYDHVWFDRGGGGREHADRLRNAGCSVNDVGFGTEKQEPKRRMTFHSERVELSGDKDTYVNRSSHMAYDLRLILERHELSDADVAKPKLASWAQSRDGRWFEYVRASGDVNGFAIADSEAELCRQLLAVPMRWDDVGKFRLIPKQVKNKDSEEETFRKLIGRSPDQFDAFCLAVHGMTAKPTRGKVQV